MVRSMESSEEVIIIGGGLAGLACARKLFEVGQSFRLFESADRVGGRVRTDVVDGFLLDRGFQVFLTAYPDASKILDYKQLDLQSFEPGALIRINGQFHRLSDPWRRPRHLFATAFSAAGTIGDKFRIAALRRQLMQDELETIYNRPEQSTLQYLEQRGFSERIISRFFKPFLGGVFLDKELQTSSRMCDFVFRMFSSGNASLPSRGMESIPKQLVDPLPANSIITNTKVTALSDREVWLQSGKKLSASAIVLAIEEHQAAKLLENKAPIAGQSVSCLYFAAASPPVAEPILILNGDSSGPINNLCVPSQVSSQYTQSGQSLISVSVLGDPDDHDDLVDAVKEQLVSWFGKSVNAWRHLRTYKINQALPSQAPGRLEPVMKPPIVAPGIFVCGDYCDTGSINGAIASGVRAAEEVLKHSS